MGKTTDTSGINFLCPSYNILVVDESEESREQVRDIVYGYGICLDEADSGKLAMKLIKEHSYDLILLKDNMPDTERIRELDEAVVSLAFSENIIFNIFDDRIPENKRRFVTDDVSESGEEDVKLAKLFMAGVDVIAGVKNNGELEDYIDLLDLFYTDGLMRVDSLKEKIETQNFHDYTIEVHGVKSSAANIGAYGLSEMAKQHEMSGKEFDYAHIEKHKEELFECYNNILEQIRYVLKKNKYGQFANQTDDEERKQIDKGELKERLLEALKSLQKFRSKDAAKSVDDLLACELEDEVRNRLDEIATMLRMYEDDDAEDALGQMIENLN